MHRHPNHHWNYRFTCLPGINDAFCNRSCTWNWCIFWIWTKRSTLWICIQIHTNQNKYPLHKNQLVFRLSITDVCNVIKYRMLHIGAIYRIQDEGNLIAHSLRCFMAPMSPFRIFTRSRWRRGFRPTKKDHPGTPAVRLDRRSVKGKYRRQIIHTQAQPCRHPYQIRRQSSLSTLRRSSLTAGVPGWSFFVGRNPRGEAPFGLSSVAAAVGGRNPRRTPPYLIFK